MKVAFLWHMHQPFYKDLVNDRFIMPWTFLHSIKDYYDMIRIIEEFEKVKVTFNFVPSLIEQIEEYEKTLEKDNFLILLKQPVKALDLNSKKNLFRQLFLANYENMIFPLKRFRELYEKKENYGEKAIELFNNQEIIDLEILYLISWCGYYIKNESEVVKKLIKKGKNFSEEDKIELLDELHKYMKKIISLYRKNFESEKIEISTSPYFHPILPLLIDVKVAKISMPQINLPFLVNNFKNDAEIQIKTGKEKFNETFGTYPKGMWPSEGSVSNDALNLIKNSGFYWVATDEDILFLSKKGIERKNLYKPYDYNGLKIFFRDKDLSNLIGFIYSKWHYEDAANDFYNRLKNIERLTNNPDAIVSIILDGENAWEYYKDNGVPFLKKMYELMENDESLEFTTFSKYFDNNSLSEKLTNIFPGSWINANFKIWIGHPEDNKAWELLDKAKSFLMEKCASNDLAFKELLISEGSDWFWWYGDEFYSEISDQFDALFRAHLSNIFITCGSEIPIDFLMPIKLQKKSILITKPVDILNPKIDGKVSNYFEWISAGEYNFAQDTSTMHFSRGFFKKMYYGFNEECLFLRFDFNKNLKELDKVQFELNLYNKESFKIVYNITNENVAVFKIKEESFIQISSNIEVAYDKILEIKINLSEFSIDKGETINLYASLFHNGNLIEKAPFDSTIKIEVPENIYLDYWKV